MNKYPQYVTVALLARMIQKFDKHPITGSSEYERAYYRHYGPDTYKVSMLVEMANKGWVLVRRERVDQRCLDIYTWARKKK